MEGGLLKNRLLLLIKRNIKLERRSKICALLNRFYNYKNKACYHVFFYSFI